VRGRLIALSDLTDEDESAWRSLAERSVQPNPLSEPDCLLPVARHLPNGRDIMLAVAEEAGCFRACLPFVVLRRWHAIPWPAATSRVRRMIYDATPLVDAEGNSSALATLVATLADERRALGPRILALEWLDDGPVSGYVREAAEALGLPLRVYDSWDRPFLARRAEATYKSLHSKKHLSDWQRRLRSLGKAIGGEPRFVDLDAEKAASAFIALEASGYKTATGVAMTEHPGEPEWFTEMCTRFASLGRLHTRALLVSDQLIAIEVMVRGGDGLFMLKVSYDETYGGYSPGIQLHIDTLNWFHGTEADWIDICTFKDNKTLLGQYPDRKRVSTVVLGLGGPLDHGTVRALGLDRFLVDKAFKAVHKLPLQRAGGSLIEGAHALSPRRAFRTPVAQTPGPV
jgi:CelD/BcsL family acetyltransferase involved in cellulose biosynthesis